MSSSPYLKVYKSISCCVFEAHFALPAQQRSRSTLCAQQQPYASYINNKLPKLPIWLSFAPLKKILLSSYQPNGLDSQRCTVHHTQLDSGHPQHYALLSNTLATYMKHCQALSSWNALALRSTIKKHSSAVWHNLELFEALSRVLQSTMESYGVLKSTGFSHVQLGGHSALERKLNRIMPSFRIGRDSRLINVRIVAPCQILSHPHPQDVHG